VCHPGWENRPPNGFGGLITPDGRVWADWQESFMLAYLWVAIGGALGSVARFWCSGVIANRFGTAFPWGTLLVNVTGSLVIGFFATATGTEGRWLAPARFREFFMIGICGGYKTFSSFSPPTLNLAGKGEWLDAGANI